MNIQIATITPAMAKEILETKNQGNRSLNWRHVEFLAKEMSRGAWKVNGDTICMNFNRLIDGQHRLAAIVMSGLSIECVIVSDLPPDVFDTKDVGRKRSGADILSIMGEKNCNRLAAALTMIHKYKTKSTGNKRGFSNTEIQELLNTYPKARDMMRSSLDRGSILTPTLTDACYYLFSEIDVQLADQFIECVILGIGVHKDSPWCLLRKRLEANRASKLKLSREYIFALCIKAWNFARQGKTTRVLKWEEGGGSPESFPVII